MLEIVDGLKEGELVLMNPRSDIPDAGERLAESAAIDRSLPPQPPAVRASAQDGDRCRRAARGYAKA